MNKPWAAAWHYQCVGKRTRRGINSATEIWHPLYAVTFSSGKRWDEIESCWKVQHIAEAEEKPKGNKKEIKKVDVNSVVEHFVGWKPLKKENTKWRCFFSTGNTLSNDKLNFSDRWPLFCIKLTSHVCVYCYPTTNCYIRSEFAVLCCRLYINHLCSWLMWYAHKCHCCHYFLKHHWG